MLERPDAPVSFEPGRASHTRHAYNFYKPNSTTEYPNVDRALSLQCYTYALDHGYKNYKQLNIERENHVPSETYNFRKTFREDGEHTKALTSASAPLFATKFAPSLVALRECGNTYTASLYSGLASLLWSVAPSNLVGRIHMFSYGSGLASRTFGFRVVGNTSQIRNHLDLGARLQRRSCAAPAEYDEVSQKPQVFTLSLHLVSRYRLLTCGDFYLPDIADNIGARACPSAEGLRAGEEFEEPRRGHSILDLYGRQIPEELCA